MSSTPTASNSNRTFTITPSSSLSSETTYKISITTDARDAAGNALSNQWTSTNGFTTGDSSAPVLAVVTPVTSPTNDTTPVFVFSSTEAGQITYWGSCNGSAASASVGNNSITFSSLSEGTYSNCKITVTDSDGNAATINVNSFTVDTTDPVIAEVAAVTANGNDPTPDYTFSSTEEGTVAYGGSCASDNTSASSGNNVVTLNTLSDATYSDCTVTITDLAGNTGNTITLTSFTVDTTAPTIVSINPADGANTVVSSISATFSEVMDHSSINTTSFTLKDASNNSISGTVTSNDSGSATTSTFTPSSSLSRSVEYTATFSTGIKDLSGNSLLSQTTTSFTQSFTQQLGSSVDEIAYGVATDSSGNVYVSGWTSGGLDGNSSAGSSDLFVVKYNSSGTKQWTQQLGTSSTDEAQGVATDSSDNVYVAVSTSGGLDGNSSAGGWDLFVVKYNSSGTKQWTKQLGTSSDDKANGVATDSSGNVYVAGSTQGGLDGNSSAGGYDLFVVKYNSSGTKQWTKQLGTSSGDSAQGVATDSSGNVNVAGETQGGMDGNSSAGGNDLFVVKYDSDGNKQ